MIISSKAPREKREGVDIREALVSMDLWGKPAVWDLGGHLEDMACQG